MNVPGGWELVLIVLVIMVLFGAKRLPSAAKDFGRSVRILREEVAQMETDDDGRDGHVGRRP